MADYIDRSIICESYIYVQNYELTDEIKERLQRLLRDYAVARAPIFFGADVIVDPIVEEGSLRLKVVVVVTAIGNLLAQYGAIRDGIEAIVKDSHYMASALVTESIFVSDVRSGDVGRTEVRTGIPGSLKRVLAKLDALQANAHSMTPDEFSASLAGARAELERVIENLPLDEDKEIVALGFAQVLEENFPVPLQPIAAQDEQNAVIVKRPEIQAFLDDLRNRRRNPDRP